VLKAILAIALAEGISSIKKANKAVRASNAAQTTNVLPSHNMMRVNAMRLA